MRLIVRVLAGTFATVLLAAACGSHPAPSPSRSSASSAQGPLSGAIATAYRTTAAAGSSRVSMTVSLSSLPGVAGTLSETGDGEFDYPNRMGTLTISIPSLGAPGAPASITTILDGSLIYEMLPAGTLLGGKPWVRIDLSNLAQASGGQAPGASPFSSDPTQALAFLLGASQGATAAGTESVRGVPTHRYHLVIDATRAIAQLPASQRTAFQNAIHSLGSSSFPADVWVDEHGLVRRLSFTLKLAPTGSSGANPTISETIEFYDFGVPVAVTTPPASQVTDLGQLPLSPPPTG